MTEHPCDVCPHALPGRFCAKYDSPSECAKYKEWHMDGIRIHDVTLFLAELPYRKSMAFCFQDGGTFYPVAYVSKKHEARAREYWRRFLNGDTAQVVK